GGCRPAGAVSRSLSHRLRAHGAARTKRSPGAALKEVPPTTRVLITIAGRLSAAGKLAKAVIAAGGTVEEMQPLKGRALSEWAAKRAVDHGLTPAIAAQVVRVTPPDLSIVDSEPKK